MHFLANYLGPSSTHAGSITSVQHIKEMNTAPILLGLYAGSAPILLGLYAGSAPMLLGPHAAWPTCWFSRGILTPALPFNPEPDPTYSP